MDLDMGSIIAAIAKSENLTQAQRAIAYNALDNAGADMMALSLAPLIKRIS